MSTGKMNTQFNTRFAELAKQGEVIFHTRDVANLWGITNLNTLYTTLKRYVQKGVLFRIYKGLYAIKPQKELDANLLGIKALHDYAYISTETVLQHAGLIQQVTPYITLIGNQSKRFSIGDEEYRCRKLQDAYLYSPIGIVDAPGKDAYALATPERAVADLLYYNPHAYFDNEQHFDDTFDKVGWDEDYMRLFDCGYIKGMQNALSKLQEIQADD
mgnify:CR=1 FL=1